MIERLVSYLKECDDAYYNTSNPLVSDDTYDAMVETLRKLDPTNEYLSKVGAQVRSNKVGRVVPMGTLSKYHEDNEVSKWLDSESGDIICSPKYDGFAVELIYVNNKLTSAGTRGTGLVGEDVTSSVQYIQNIPQEISGYDNQEVIIRGEAIIPTKNHEVVKSLGYTAMRNAVPGIVRGCNQVALKYVDFVAYEFLDGRDDRVAQRDFWKDYFTVEDYRMFKSTEMDKIQERRSELRENTYLYELDGIVLKSRMIKEDDLLNPKHSIAWKYKSNRETTILRGVEFQMGVTGYFTPVGMFDEVEFQGAKLSRASLGNITRMRSEFSGMTIGSIIEVSRRGDIIPYIEALNLIDDKGEVVELPKVCPHCGQPLSDYDTEPHCTNPACPERLRLQITQYARSLGVKGIGDKLVSLLIEYGYIKSILDIYKIDPRVILELPRQGESSVEKWRTLQNRKLSNLELLSSYPFLDLGEKIWKVVLEKFTFEQILDITADDLRNASLKGIGESKIQNIVSQISLSREDLAVLKTIVQ